MALKSKWSVRHLILIKLKSADDMWQQENDLLKAIMLRYVKFWTSRSAGADVFTRHLTADGFCFCVEKLNLCDDGCRSCLSPTSNGSARWRLDQGFARGASMANDEGCWRSV